MSDIARPGSPLFGSPGGVSGEGRVVHHLFGAAPGRQIEAPYLSWLSVDGFGRLAGLEVAELSPAMNVVVGPNEAGKSTVFDFIAGVLFGFPTRKADDRFHLPVSGGRHGGRLGIVGPSGELVVERHGLPTKQLVVTHGDGSAANEDDLRRALGGASRELFRSVFAVDLDDLRRIDGLSTDEVREVLFSSSIVGQRRTAAQALKALDAERELLVRPRQGGRANDLAASLQAARAALAGARSEAARYAATQAEADAAAHRVAELKDALETERAANAELQLLIRCWELVVSRRDAIARLEALPPLSEADERAIAAAGDARRVRAELSGHGERLSAMADVAARLADVGESIARRREELGDWAVALAGDQTVDLSELRGRITRSTGALAKAASEHEAARSIVRSIEDERPAVGSELAEATAGAGALPPITVLEDRVSGLRALRRLVAEHEQLQRDAERDAAEAERQREAARLAAAAAEAAAAVSASVSAARTPLAQLIAFGAPAVIMLVGVAALATGHTMAGIAGLALGLAVAGALVAERHQAHQARRRTSGVPVHRAREEDTGSGDSGGGGDGDDGDGRDNPPLQQEGRAAGAERADRIIRLRSELSAAAQALALADPVTVVTVENALEAAEHALARRRMADEAARAVADHRRRLDLGIERTTATGRSLDRAQAAVAEIARSGGLPETTDPAELLSVVEQLTILRDRMEAAARLQPDLAGRRDEVMGFEDDVVDLAHRLGLAAGIEPPEGGAPFTLHALERLIGAIEQEVARATELSDARADLEAAIGLADRESLRTFGEGVRAEQLRRELETGEILAWQGAIDSGRSRVSRLESEYELAVRQHEGLTRRLHDLASSTAIPELEQRCEALEAELDEVLRRYLVTSGARLLINRTLRRYTEERQPAVLASAAEHFCRVTDGLYQRLVIDHGSDDASPSIRLVRNDGHVLDASPGTLSRGTIEQLYLCLRLGLAESFGERYHPLPILLDDVLVNFDPERSVAVVRELTETADRHQVILMTCHPHLADLVAEHAPRTKVIELER